MAQPTERSLILLLVFLIVPARSWCTMADLVSTTAIAVSSGAVGARVRSTRTCSLVLGVWEALVG